MGKSSYLFAWIDETDAVRQNIDELFLMLCRKHREEDRGAAGSGWLVYKS